MESACNPPADDCKFCKKNHLGVKAKAFEIGCAVRRKHEQCQSCEWCREQSNHRTKLRFITAAAQRLDDRARSNLCSEISRNLHFRLVLYGAIDARLHICG